MIEDNIFVNKLFICICLYATIILIAVSINMISFGCDCIMRNDTVFIFDCFIEDKLYGCM